MRKVEIEWRIKELVRQTCRWVGRFGHCGNHTVNRDGHDGEEGRRSVGWCVSTLEIMGSSEVGVVRSDS